MLTYRTEQEIIERTTKGIFNILKYILQFKNFLLIVKNNLLETSRSNLIFTKIFIYIYLQEFYIIL